MSLRLEGENNVVSVGPRAEKFNIVSNDHGGTHKCDYYRFQPEIPFLGKFGPKNENCQFKLKFGT